MVKSAKTSESSRYIKASPGGEQQQLTCSALIQCQVRRRRAPARKHTTVLKISMHLSHHSTSGLTKRTLLRSLNSPYQFVEKREGQMAHSSKNSTWAQFDDLGGILETTQKGPVHRKIYSLTIMTYNFAKERFSPIEQRGQPQPPQKPNRWEREMHRLRKEIKALNKKDQLSCVSTAGHNTFISRGRRKRKCEHSLSKIPMASQRLFSASLNLAY